MFATMKTVLICFVIVFSLKILSTVSVSIRTQNYAEFNMRNHRTSDFHSVGNNLILRRCQTFAMDILGLPTSYSTADQIELKFVYETKGSVSFSFYVVNGLTLDKSKWSASAYNSGANAVNLQISSPSDAPVGKYRLELSVIQRGVLYSTTVYDIYILFNAWCLSDSVYMESEAERQEYVLNPYIISYQGSVDALQANPFFLGQFEASVFAGTWQLIQYNGQLSAYDMGNPVLVMRMLTALANVQDDNGILVGRWQEPYAPFTQPWIWSAVPNIFEQYAQSGPVKYGQCWVFSALLTAMLRGIGIPARSVTNFNSAHDTNFNLQVDKYYDSYGNIISSLSEDNVWNFHVWTEGWSSRPDLQSKLYDGWQVVDATPQEMSEGRYQNGPTSINGIKYGQINIKYDSIFSFSEVNADKVTYKSNGNRGFILTNRDTSSIGLKIVTKELGSISKVYRDITSLYKVQEGTPAERNIYSIAAANAGYRVASADRSSLIDKNDVNIEIITEESLPLGSTLIVTLVITNIRSELRTVEVKLVIKSIHYTGKKHLEIKTYNETFEIQPKSAIEQQIELSPEEYMGKLVHFQFVEIDVNANIEENHQHILASKRYAFSNHELKLAVYEEDILVGMPFTVKIEFTNEVGLELENCILTIELKDVDKIVHEVISIKENERLIHKETLTSNKVGDEVVLVKLICTNLFEAKSFLNLKIKGDDKRNRTPKFVPPNRYHHLFMKQ